MYRWENNHKTFPFLGRLGDTIQFTDLPGGVQTLELAEGLGIVVADEEVVTAEACGSRGEVATSDVWV